MQEQDLENSEEKPKYMKERDELMQQFYDQETDTAAQSDETEQEAKDLEQEQS